MTEKVLNNKKNGMAMLLLFGLLYAAAIGLAVLGGIGMDNHLLWAIPVFVVGVIWICVGWIPFGPEGTQTPGGPGADPVRPLCGHTEE